MLTEAIAALSEDDQETLGDYIEAYEDAVAALEAARAEAEEGDDLSSYDEAVRTAAEALRAAAADAGIELAMPERGEGNLSDGDCGGRGFGAPMLAESHQRGDQRAR
jgi:hypothetical protein